MIRVLIVDDDKLARKGLISIMPWSSHNMEIVGEAANGAKALEFLSNNAVDLMFVDISMPVLSGIELIEKSRKLYPKLYFVVLTFHEDFEYVQTTFRLGVLDYISKIQLEMEDYDEILSRIEQRLNIELQKEGRLQRYENQRDSNESAASLRDTANEEKWHRLEQEWCSLYWLFDDAAFQRLCMEMTETNLPVHQIEELLMRVVLHVEVTVHIKIEMPFDIKNMKSAIEWIKHYRDLIYSHISQADNFTDTPVCMLKAVLFIRKQISTPISTEVVADYVNMSRSYFSQCFKKFVGLTFNNFLRQERVHMAEQLLCHSSRPIGEIARNVGYGDVKYFSQIFHQQTGLLPSEFRSQFHNGDK